MPVAAEVAEAEAEEEGVAAVEVAGVLDDRFHESCQLS